MSNEKYSPLTQEVSDTANKAYWLWDLYPADADAIAAATLRAVVEKILPKEVDPEGEWTEIDELRYQLLTVIVELEGGWLKTLNLDSAVGRLTQRSLPAKMRQTLKSNDKNQSHQAN